MKHNGSENVQIPPARYPYRSIDLIVNLRPCKERQRARPPDQCPAKSQQSVHGCSERSSCTKSLVPEEGLGLEQDR
jgi:hypothetical protein